MELIYLSILGTSKLVLNKCIIFLLPGQMQLTLMLNFANSLAADLVKPITPALEAE